jgi:predicted Zn-dependent protease with MMP-like domain
MSEDEFAELAEEALADLPDQFAAALEIVAIVIEDDPPPDEPEDLLGLFEGVPLPERGFEGGDLPDLIRIFRNPTLAICQTREDVADEVYTTVFHELGHYFGLDDDRLHELDWA